MKKLHYIIISALLVGGCQSDPRLESEASPLVRTKVSELYYAQSDNIDLEALNIVSPSKFVKKGNLYAIFELPRIADLTIKTLQSVLVYSVTKKASIIALARSELI